MSLLATTLATALATAVERGIIAFDDDQKFITYAHRNKKYRFSDPEEQVRAETFCSLVLDYGYKPERIDIEVVMPGRTPNFYADIVVYADDAKTFVFIVVECKKAEANEAEFQQAIEQGFGNAISLRANYLWVTSGIKSKYYNTSDTFGAAERVKNIIASVPRFGKQVKRAKLYKGGIDEDGGAAFDPKTVSQEELTRIFGTAHQALWGGGKRNEIEALDEFNKLIFCKLWDEKSPRKKGDPYDFQEFTGEAPEYLVNRIRALYNKGREKDPEVFRDDIRLPAEELKTIVGYLADINLGKTDLDSKGRAFEKFVGSNFRGKFGAYFTPREVVNAALKTETQDYPIFVAGVNAELLKTIPIPLPPLATQERVAAEASSRREQAKVLEREAVELLAAAKADVERLILGEV
jgi:type I restriction enzyme M protein